MRATYSLRLFSIISGLLLLVVVSVGKATAADRAPLISVGVAKVDITPKGPIRLAGYGDRRIEATHVAGKIWAKALAIGSDQQKPCLLITAELIRAPGALVEPLARRLKKRVGLERSQIAVCATHTHTGPALANMLVDSYFGSNIPPVQQDRIKRYTERLLDLLEQVAINAFNNRQPSRLAWSEGKVGFAVNRRQIRQGAWVGMRPNPNGPVDHALPLLSVTDAEGKLRALFLNYACHCTTYGSKFNQIHGDWAGVAAQIIEAEHPDCIALIALGCGGDANPKPRGAIDGFQLVNRHGAAVANEVKRLLGNKMTPLQTVPACRIRRLSLPLDHIPDRAELQKRLKRGANAAYFAKILLERLDQGKTILGSFPYLVQAWNFDDDLSIVFLAGEVVSGYSLRLKREAGNQHLWINAYSNDDPCYIATRKMILEGGYEVVQSMDSFAKASHLSLKVEDMIIEAVQSLIQ